MRVFQDVFTDEEFMSETYKFELAYEEAIMKVGSTYKKKEAVGNVDIGCGNAFGGSNEDEEEGGSAPGEEPQEKVIDIAYNFGLCEQSLSKADFMGYIKEYCKKLKLKLTETNPSRVDGFMKGIGAFIKQVVGENFNDYVFYTGSKETLDGGIAISYWEDESAAGPMFYFFRDGLKEIKY